MSKVTHEELAEVKRELEDFTLTERKAHEKYCHGDYSREARDIRELRYEIQVESEALNELSKKLAAICDHLGVCLVSVPAKLSPHHYHVTKKPKEKGK